MSQFAIEDLFRTASGDGVTIPLRFSPSRTDSDEILKAWNIERSHSIECELLLKLLRRAMARSLKAKFPPSEASNRKNRDLIRAIDTRLNKSPSGLS